MLAMHINTNNTGKIITVEAVDTEMHILSRFSLFRFLLENWRSSVSNSCLIVICWVVSGLKLGDGQTM